MISIIICSKSHDLLKKISLNIADTIGVSYEIIPILNPHGKFGICKAYNDGASQAVYDILCFCHEDILFHNINWGKNLIEHLSNRTISLVGVLGCVVKTKAPSGAYISQKNLNRINQIQRLPDDTTIHYYENPKNEAVSEVSILDGMFLSCTKSNWQRKKFDENLKGFHGYDIDFSLSQKENGTILVVYDILLEHFSSGGNSRTWIDAQLFVTEKWKNRLPVVQKDITLTMLKKAEIENLNTFTISLIKHKYAKKETVLNISRIIFAKPFQRLNLFFIKQLFRFLYNGD